MSVVSVLILTVILLAGNGQCLPDEVLMVRRINPAMVMSARAGEESKDGSHDTSTGVFPNSIPACCVGRDIVSQTKLVYYSGNNRENRK